MKKFILAALLVCTGICVNAQNLFELKYDQPFTTQVESSVPGKTAADLYLNTLKWINTDMANVQVHGTKHEMDKTVTLEAEYPALMAVNSLGSKVTYKTRVYIKLEFFDNRYTFKYLSLEYYNPTLGKWVEFFINDQKNLFNKKGELRSMNKHVADIPVAINSLYFDLDKYLKDSK
ncbi:hypothetical protein [Flavobacterium psychrotrophum]|uniref:hypothetical protein n=1 Tax=Flavobacterium psychrotrophum TaxID=2294119 RepID=UPI000E32021F|nr:hypothetical protein [Flavobacterium psychrotrophum]